MATPAQATDEPGQPPKLTTAVLAEQAPSPSGAVEQRITPFEVSGGIDASGKLLPVDYDKLTRDFGASPITPELLARFEQVTGKKAHRFMRRGIVLSHRELNLILDRYEKGQPFYLYTGRGPSSDSMHVGHAVPFEFTRYLQEVFDCPLVIQLTDDEKFMHSKKFTYDDCQRFARENAKDIIAIGFDIRKTFIFQDTQYMSVMYKNIISMARMISINQITGTFGFNASNNIGEYFFPAVQSAPSFATSFPHIFGEDEKKVRSIPCLIPCAIDQDPYFRQTRDNAEKLKFKKPALIHSIFLPALQGPGSKMSASIDSSAIFLTDKPANIKNKINKHAFSGGQDTLEKHRELGGRSKDDVPFQYLTFFMEDDDELERLRAGYEKGEIMTGEMKATCIKYLQEYVVAFQERRAKVTDEIRQQFMTPRKLEYQGNSNPKVEEPKEKEKGKDKDKGAAVKEKEKEKKPDGDNKGHQKKMSLGGNKVSVKEENELSRDANGEVSQRLKRLSVTKTG